MRSGSDRDRTLSSWLRRIPARPLLVRLHSAHVAQREVRRHLNPIAGDDRCRGIAVGALATIADEGPGAEQDGRPCRLADSGRRAIVPATCARLARRQGGRARSPINDLQLCLAEEPLCPIEEPRRSGRSSDKMARAAMCDRWFASTGNSPRPEATCPALPCTRLPAVWKSAGARRNVIVIIYVGAG